MSSHNVLIQRALARSVRPGTVLQDAIIKVRRYRRKGEAEFEIALGELFVLASEVFRERNGLKNDCRTLAKEVKRLQDEIRYLKEDTDDYL